MSNCPTPSPTAYANCHPHPQRWVGTSGAHQQRECSQMQAVDLFRFFIYILTVQAGPFDIGLSIVVAFCMEDNVIQSTNRLKDRSYQ